MITYPKTIEESYYLARLTNTCPICPYCREPLTLISQTQQTYIDWKWSEADGYYVKKDDDGDADKPFHDSPNCGAHDWDFIDEELVSF